MRLKHFLYCQLALLLLVGTFFTPSTRVYWNALDVWVFKLLNGSLLTNQPSCIFWSLLNHKMTDWVEDFIFIIFFALAVKQVPRQERLKKTSQFLFCIIFASIMIFCVNKVLFREHLKIPRPSPSLVITPCIKPSEQISWLKTKETASKSFPGDHATTVIFFAVSYTFFAGRKLGFFAILYAILRSLPRLIIGAHWLTDVFVGSGSIVLFFTSLFLCTPLQKWGPHCIETFLKMFKSPKMVSHEN